MPAEKLGQPPPILLAMLLADHIHTDTSTGKRFILGTYNRLMAPKFPHTVPRMSIFLAFTGGHGPTIFRLRIVDMDEEIGPLLESAYPVNLSNPNDILYLPVTLSVVFPTPGMYRIQVLVENEVLRELCFHVEKTQPPR